MTKKICQFENNSLHLTSKLQHCFLDIMLPQQGYILQLTWNLENNATVHSCSRSCTLVRALYAPQQ